MPPHCDSLDGPVVLAAKAALEADDINLVLPYVHAEGETEVQEAFDRVMPVRALGSEAQEVADLSFFETVVRVHREGEKAPYTGLKPAGLDVGPVIPLAERAGTQLQSDQLADFLCKEIHTQIDKRIENLRELETRRTTSLENEREYVEALLGLQVYSHRLYRQMQARSDH